MSPSAPSPSQCGRRPAPDQSGGSTPAPSSASTEAVLRASQSVASAASTSRSVALVLSSLAGGGSERVASTLAARWSEAGWRVTVVTLGGKDTDIYRLHPAVVRKELRLLGPSSNWVVGAVRALVRVAAVRRALASVRPDVVVSFNDTTNIVTLLATVGMRAPRLACERADPRYAHNRWPWRLLRRVLYARAASVVVQTESVARWARARWRRVHVIPNFVDAPAMFAAPGVTHGPRTLIAVGRLDPVKGFDLLLEAFARVAGGAPEWTLCILGEGPERAALEARVAQLGLGTRVRMPGRAQDPVPHLCAAHAFVLSSRSEGFPNALLEAMACGLPAVAFDCPSGPAEIITDGHDGVLVPCGDVERLAQALRHLFADDGRRAALGQNARAIVRKLSPERVLRLWSELIEG